MSGVITSQPRRFNNERGTALILAIVFMAILSFLGALVMDVVNRGNRMIGGTRAGGDFVQDRAGLIPEREAFYLVDRTVGYGLSTRIIEEMNLLIDLGTPQPIINFKTDTTENAAGVLVPHETLIRAGGLSLMEGQIQRLSVANISFDAISRVAPGSSAKDIFIIYHLEAAACPRNVNCDTYPQEAVRVDAHLVEVRPNPSGGSGSSEETEESIWGSPKI